MRRWLGWLAIAWLLLLCAVALAAYGNPSTPPSLDARTRSLAAQLRCPVCQGESVADSPTGIARSMRAIIRQRLAEGQSPQEVKDYFVSRYGSWILLSPPTSGIGALAWLAPPLLALGGLGLLLTLLLQWRRQGEIAAPPGEQSYLERVRAEYAADPGLE